MKEILFTRFGLATHFFGVPVNDLTDKDYQKYKQSIASFKEIEKNDNDFIKMISHWWKR